MTIVIIPAMFALVVGEIFDPIDDRAGTAHKPFFVLLIDAPVAERGRIQHRFYLRGQGIPLHQIDDSAKIE